MTEKTKKRIDSLNEKKPQLSQEELTQRRKEITKFYTDNIPHLKTQAKYEALLCEIEESRAKRMQAQMFMAQKQNEGVKPNSEEAKKFKQAMENAAKNVK